MAIRGELPRWRHLATGTGTFELWGPLAIGRSSAVGLRATALAAAVGSGQVSVTLYGCGSSGAETPSELYALGELQCGALLEGEAAVLPPVPCPATHVLVVLTTAQYTLIGESPESPPSLRIELMEDGLAAPPEVQEARAYVGALANLELDLLAPLGATRAYVGLSLNSEDLTSDFVAAVYSGSVSERVLAGPVSVQRSTPLDELTWDVGANRFYRLVITGEATAGRTLRVSVGYSAGGGSTAAAVVEPEAQAAPREPLLLPLIGRAAEGNTVVPASGHLRLVALGYPGRVVAAGSVRQARFAVNVAPTGVTWAEIALYRGAPTFGAASTLTRLAHTDVAALVATTGVKTPQLTLPELQPDDYLWLGLALDAGANMAVEGAGHRDYLETVSLHAARAASTRPSTNATVNVAGETAVPIWAVLNLAPIPT